jgi:hypothetical protein
MPLSRASRRTAGDVSTRSATSSSPMLPLMEGWRSSRRAAARRGGSGQRLQHMRLLASCASEQRQGERSAAF